MKELRKEVAAMRDMLAGFIQTNPAPVSKVRLLHETLSFHAETVDQLSELSTWLERQQDATEDFVSFIVQYCISR